MDHQLYRAPVGYVVMDKSWEVLEVNRTYLEMTGHVSAPSNVREVLTVSGWVYFQTYFIPAMELHGMVKEMELSLRCAEGRMPALLSAVETDGHYECAIMPIPVRGEYEAELLRAKREAERIRMETEEANVRLMELVQEIEARQTELIQLNERFQLLSVTDPLTGLPNRRAFEKRLKLLRDIPIAILALDIDHFKQVNDTYGHDAGDEVLKEVAAVLKEAAGETSGTDGVGVYPSRVGGEEFSVILETASEHVATAIAERIRNRVSAISHPDPVTLSIGVSLKRDGEPHAMLLKRADEALYQSKRNGRNRVTVWM